MSRNPLVYSSGLFSGVWVFMAWIQPETNFFLFPVLIGASLPVSHRLIVGRPLNSPAAMAAAIAAMLNVAITSLLLYFVDRLNGQAVIDGLNILAEAFIMGGLGAAGGIVFAVLGGQRRT